MYFNGNFHYNISVKFINNFLRMNGKMNCEIKIAINNVYISTVK